MDGRFPSINGPLGADPELASAEPQVRDNPKVAEEKPPIDKQEKETTADLIDSQIPKKPIKFYRPDDKAWMRAYVDLSELPKDLVKSAFWAVVWLFIYESQLPTAQAQIDREGKFYIRCTKIPRVARAKISEGLTARGMRFEIFSKQWPTVLPLDPKEEYFAGVFTCKQRNAFVSDHAAKLIEAHIGHATPAQIED